MKRNPVAIIMAAVALWLGAASLPAQTSGPFSVPQPQPLPLLSPPPMPNFVHLQPGEGNSVAAIHTAHAVEVWRPQSRSPQMPARQGRRFRVAYAVGRESMTLRLRFDPRAAGNEVVVQPGPGVTIDGPETALQLDRAGQCVVSVKLDGTFNRSDLTIYCLGFQIKLPLARATAAEVEAQEA